jgi:hypothetical protein
MTRKRKRKREKKERQIELVLAVLFTAVIFGGGIYMYMVLYSFPIMAKSLVVCPEYKYPECPKCRSCNDSWNCGDRPVQNKTMLSATGYYYHDQYYCVWVQDRDTEAIMDTDYHEMCHHLVQENRDHFCDGAPYMGTKE